MTKLYDKVATLNIAGRQFESPPFRVAIEQSLCAGVPTSTVCRLFNPNSETIKSGTPSQLPTGWNMPQVTIDAGYKDDHGTCCLGKVYYSEVKKEGVDTVLEMKIIDATSQWMYSIVNMSFSQTTATMIIQNLIGMVGIAMGSIQLGKEKTYQNFTAFGPFSNVIRQLCRDTESEMYFQNGSLIIQPFTKPGTAQVIVLSSNTGLIGVPQKIYGGAKFKALFLYKMQAGSMVQIQSDNVNGLYKVWNGKKKFDSHGASESEYDAWQV